jgi:peptide-methionine (S)-S-oxide reductase
MELEIKEEKAIFGAGCFWGVEAAFRKIPGVIDVLVGYMGGSTERPTYEEVCTNKTGHVEVVQVVYNSKQVSYQELLAAFWYMHDPTQVNKQGADVGTQYRSVIFYYTPEQQREAEASKQELEVSGALKKPVATAVEPASTFWRAEEYHQRYAEKQGGVC